MLDLIHEHWDYTALSLLGTGHRLDYCNIIETWEILFASYSHFSSARLHLINRFTCLSPRIPRSGSKLVELWNFESFSPLSWSLERAGLWSWMAIFLVMSWQWLPRNLMSLAQIMGWCRQVELSNITDLSLGATFVIKSTLCCQISQEKYKTVCLRK